MSSRDYAGLAEAQALMAGMDALADEARRLAARCETPEDSRWPWYRQRIRGILHSYVELARLEDVGDSGYQQDCRIADRLCVALASPAADIPWAGARPPAMSVDLAVQCVELAIGLVPSVGIVENLRRERR